MKDFVSTTDFKSNHQGARFESKNRNKENHPPKSKKKEKIQFTKESYENYLNLDALKIGDVEYKVKFSKDLPVLSYEAFTKLFYNIVGRGVKYTVVVDEHNSIIDGRFRLIAAVILKLKQIPFLIESGLTDAEKYDLAYDMNIHRRQLTEEQQSELVIKYRKDGKSYREIGQELGICHNSVRNIVLAAGVQNLTPDIPLTITGRDGKQYPSTVERKNNPTVFAKSVSEAKGAAQACVAVGAENLPDKMIDLKRLNKIASAVKNEQLREKTYADIKNGSYQLFLGDFREKAQEIEDESIDMILTDPPYLEKFLPIWNDLGILAKRVLRPGGLLLSYSGGMYLPQIYQMLGNHLEYVWTLGILHTGHTAIVHPVNVVQNWKPILWYVKPPRNKYWQIFPDMFSGGQREKTHHEWQQAVGEAEYYLKALCPQDAVVLDPMCGSATTIIAAKQLGYKAIGIEADPARFAVAQQRLSEIG